MKKNKKIINGFSLLGIIVFFILAVVSEANYLLFDIYLSFILVLLLFISVFNLGLYVFGSKGNIIAKIISATIMMLLVPILIGGIVTTIDLFQDKKAYENKDYSVVTGQVDSETFGMNELSYVTIDDVDYYFIIKPVSKEQFEELVDVNEEYSMELHYLPNSLEVMEWEIIQ